MREALAALWQARSGGAVAWALWRHGVCEGCSLGHGGPHLCAPGLRALRTVSAEPLVPADLLDIRRLRRLGGARGRLAHPYHYRPGDRGFVRMGWEQALERLRAAELCVQGRPDSEETRLALDGMARVRKSSGGQAALRRGIGWGDSTADLTDLTQAELVLVWRSACDSNPLVATTLAAARREGARIVLVGTEPEITAYDDWIRLDEAGDLLLSDALVSGLEPRPDLERFTTGLDAVRARALAPRAMSEATGVHSGAVDWLLRLLGGAERVVTLSSQSAPPTTLQAILNLHLAMDAVSGPGRGILLLSRPSDEGLTLQAPGFRAHLHHSLTDEMLEEDDEVLLLPATSLHEREGGALRRTAGLWVQGIPQLLHPPGEARDPWTVLDELTETGRGSVEELREEGGLRHGPLPRPCADHAYDALPDGLARLA